MSNIVRVFLAAGFCFLVSAVYAQPGPPPDPDQVPITGIELLVGIGSLFGVKKLFQSRNKK